MTRGDHPGDVPNVTAWPAWMAPLVGAAIFGLSLVVYWAATGFGFVNVDDQTYVTANTVVQKGLTWEGFTWAFTTMHGSNWHPLTWLSHMVDVSSFGLDAGKHHLVSILIHAVNSVLLFAWLRRATGSLWRSALVGALFAVHPLHVESVAWISERKDVLSTFFWLVAMFAYLEWERHRGGARYAVLAGAFTLGLLAKPMVVTLPFALLLVDAWPLGRVGGLDPEDPFDWRRIKPLVREKVPLFALAALSSAVTVVAQRGSATATLEAIPLGDRVWNSLVSYAVYLEKVFWPSGLAAFYPHPSAGGSGPSAECGAVAAAILVAVTVAAFVLRRAHPQLLWGWLWFLGTLLPVIGIVQVGLQSHADRYVYIPSIGVLIAVTWLAAALARTSRVARHALVAAAVVAIATLSFATSLQVQHWRSSEALWRRAIAVTAGNWQAWTGLGDALFESGRPAEAADAHRRSLQIRPDNPVAWNGVGVSLGQLGLHADAIDHFQQAIRIDPGNADAWYNLGTAHGNLGEHRRARAALERAAALRPSDPRIWANLAVARAALGDRTGSAEAMKRLEVLDPAQAAEMPR